MMVTVGEMVQRIYYAMFDVGIDRWEVTPDVDHDAHETPRPELPGLGTP